MQKMIVIDGNSLLFRAYYATAYGGSIMRTKAGVPTNALFAFSNMIGKILGDLSGDEHLLVAWDTGEKTLRHKEDETYKANRPDAPIDLVPQFALAREFLKALGIKSYETPDYEADDIAGSIAKRAGKDGFSVEIYTSDQDFLQLVDENIVVQLIKNGSKIETMDVKGVLETYEMTPLQIIDYKGLRGDPSDNIPGVPGVGKVIGTKLIPVNILTGRFGNASAEVAAMASFLWMLPGALAARGNIQAQRRVGDAELFRRGYITRTFKYGDALTRFFRFRKTNREGGP